MNTFMFFIQAVTLALAAVVTPELVRREYNPDEYLVLGDCGIDKDPNGASSAFRMVYYPHKPGFAGGKELSALYMPVPWDGSYPWRSDGVSSKATNGDTFTAYIDGTVPDWKESHNIAGRAKHTYDGNWFACWGDHGHRFITIDSGATNCFTTYICAHEDNVPKTPTRLSFYTSKDRVQLRGHWTADQLFGNVPFGGTDNAYCKKDQTVDLSGSDCKISYECGPLNGDALAKSRKFPRACRTRAPNILHRDIAVLTKVIYSATPSRQHHSFPRNRPRHQNNLLERHVPLVVSSRARLPARGPLLRRRRGRCRRSLVESSAERQTGSHPGRRRDEHRFLQL
jgi:hypothetical protein